MLENRFQECCSNLLIIQLLSCLQQTPPHTKLHGHDIIFVVYLRYYVIKWDAAFVCCGAEKYQCDKSRPFIMEAKTYFLHYYRYVLQFELFYCRSWKTNM